MHAFITFRLDLFFKSSVWEQNLFKSYDTNTFWQCLQVFFDYISPQFLKLFMHIKLFIFSFDYLTCTRGERANIWNIQVLIWMLLYWKCIFIHWLCYIFKEQDKVCGVCCSISCIRYVFVPFTNVNLAWEQNIEVDLQQIFKDLFKGWFFLIFFCHWLWLLCSSIFRIRLFWAEIGGQKKLWIWLNAVKIQDRVWCVKEV